MSGWKYTPQTGWYIDYSTPDNTGAGAAGANGASASPDSRINYNSGPDAQGYGGPGEIMGGDRVPYHGINLPYFQQDRDRLQGLLGNQKPMQDWGDLISQLKDRANGNTPSLAQQNYNSASQNTTNALSSMSRGSSNPEAAREAMIQQGRIGQGQAAGLALAGTQEQQGNQQALTTALGGRDQTYMSVLGKQLGLSQGQLSALQGDQSYNADIYGKESANNQKSAENAQKMAQMLAMIAMLV